jgi:hypothetical protein
MVNSRNMTNQNCIQIPLFCHFQHHVLGPGFIAQIEMRARVTAEKSHEGVWLYGVNPGAIAVNGSTMNEAVVNLRDSLQLVLIDFMVAAKGDWLTFKKRVETFVAATNDEAVDEWLAARKAVRAGKVDIEGMNSTKKALEFTVKTTKLRLAISENLVPQQPQIAA